jgi:mannose-6-phosphate isomerase-like protein (cupin superfamily)
MKKGVPTHAQLLFGISLLLFLIAPVLRAQTRQVDPSWLHRYVPAIKETPVDLTAPGCHYKPIFGEGDASRSLINVTRFGEATVDVNGKCQDLGYERGEELYFVLAGKGVLSYGDQSYPLHKNDFTYIAPGVKHSISNNSQEALRVVVMTFKVPSSISISSPPPQPKIVNMADLKEQTVEGHPTSVLYKLLAGPRNGTQRDAIDQAYVVVSLFLMDFAPGGTNFPHHHESAEEIYLVIDGDGEMVAGGGMNGVEGRHPAKAGDAYYFRPNCTVGFYNQKSPGAKAHILAVRSRIRLPEPEE